MLDSILNFVAPALAFLASKYGPIGEAFGYIVLFGIPLVSILIEIAETAAALTKSASDDAAVADAKTKWAKVVKTLEFLPHVNLPLAPIFLKILAIAGKVLSALKSLKE